MLLPMNPIFLERLFKIEASDTSEWPAEFSIITALLTTRESLSDERKAEADRCPWS